MRKTCARGEIHAKITRNKGQRCEEYRHNGENHHEVVRLGTDGIEDERRNVVGAGIHLLECLDQGDTVVEHIATTEKGQFASCKVSRAEKRRTSKYVRAA